MTKSEVEASTHATPDKQSHPDSASGEKDPEKPLTALIGRPQVVGVENTKNDKNYTLLVWYLDRVG
eukprot:COSAG05_NODE_404_length_10192_cov_3.830377_6_plen_66_part_00